MPARRTKALYVAHQRSFRHAPNADVWIEREWKYKTATQRADLVRELENLDVAKARLVVCRNASRGDVQWITTELAKTARDVPILINVIDRVLPRLRDLAEAQRRVGDVWGQLAAVERGHHGTKRQASIRHADSQSAAHIAERQATEQRIVDWTAERDSPAVPLDTHGRERYPEFWLGRDLEIISPGDINTLERGAGNLGLQVAGAGDWVPWKQYRGGQSEGWLWLSLDPATQTVIDVSRLPTLPSPTSVLGCVTDCYTARFPQRCPLDHGRLVRCSQIRWRCKT